MDKSILSRLKSAGLLTDELPDLGDIPTGSYALNKVISGDYRKGIPVGAITQIHGESSTAKTIFATHLLIEAQKKGYYAVLIDSENSYNPVFAEDIGLKPDELIYSAPETVEECFETAENIIKEIRQTDTDTPILICYDSLAVSPSKAEYEAEGYEGNNMQGAVRAKAIGACLRKFNPILKKEKVAFFVINQIRHKVGVLFGTPETKASGGKSLDYYLGVDLKTISNKTSDLIKNDKKEVIGIVGTIRNTKNKVSRPFRECSFKLIFDEGLVPEYGLLDQFKKDGLIETKGAGWCTVLETGEKFQGEDAFMRLLPETESLAKLIQE